MATDYFGTMGNQYPFGYQKQFPTRVISGTNILELNGEQQQTLIGHTLSYCNEMESALNEAVEKAEKFYKRLVELGDIIPEKTAEEIAKENNAQQQAINISLLETIQKLSDKIERMEGSNNARLCKDSNDSSESSPTGHSGKSGKGTK